MFSYENSNSKTYVVYKFEASDTIDSLSLGMISNNTISNFAPAVYTQIDDAKMIKYDVTSRITASQIFSGIVKRKWFIEILRSIMDAISAADDYMIVSDSIVLDLNYIFVDISTGKAIMLCLPVANPTQNELGPFVKDLVCNTQFDQNENCDYIAKIINYLNTTPRFSVKDFKKLLDSLDGSSAPAPSAAGVRSNAGQPNRQPASKPSTSAYATASPAKPSMPSAPSAPSTPSTPSSSFTVTQKTAGAPEINIPNKTNTSIPQPSAGDMPIPNAKKGKTPASAPAVPEEESGQKMSLYYLLSHYNKENAAIYKAQKGNKNKAEAPVAAPNKKAKNTAVPTSTPDSDFAIPGQAKMPTPLSSTPAPVAPVAPAPSVPAPKAAAPSAPVAAPSFPKQEVVTVSADFGETNVLGGSSDGETMVLGDMSANSSVPGKQQAYILRVRNGEKIPVNKIVFRIGKEKSYVDYFIGDNSYISRGHADIITRDEKYYIIDNNSRNHTYVNGNVITSNTEVELHTGDTFSLGNEAFEFKLF